MAFVPSPDAHAEDDALRDGGAARPGHGIGLTRRTIVRAGAALGTTAWLGGLVGAGPAWASGASRSMGTPLVLGRADLHPGRVLGPIPAPRRFDLLGAPVGQLAGVGLRIRARTHGGRWSGWLPLSDHDGHAPDGRRAAMSDPVWFGDADEIQVRVARRPARDLRLDLVTVPPSVKRSASRATARAAARGGIAVPAQATARAGGATPRAAAPTIIPRAAWSAPSPKASPDLGQVQLAFVHHTVNGNDYAASESPALVRAIADYHMRSNGWNDIGYNFLVDRYGQVFEGRAGGIDQAVIGAQAIGWNSVSTGIAIIGTFEGVPAPDAALNAVASLIGWKLPLHGAPTAGELSLVSSGGSGNRWPSGKDVTLNRISGHQDGCSTDCPGRALYGQLDVIRERVGAVLPSRVATDVLTVSAPQGFAAYGAQLQLTGRLTSDGAGVGGSQVVIQKKGPSGTWVPITRVATDGDGRWTTAISWKASTAVRAVAGDVVSKQITPGLDPALTINQPASRVRVGRTVLVRGRARGVRTVDVVLRRKRGKSYVLASRKSVPLKGGRFSGRLPVRGAGRQRVTVEARSAGRRYESVRKYLRGVR